MSPELLAVISKYRDHPEFLGIDIVDVNQPGAVDDTLLHIASRSGSVDDVKVLVSSGARVNAPGDMGFTALHFAAMKGRVDLVELLLAMGADPTVENEWGEVPAETAAKGGHQDVAKALASRTRRR